MASGCGVRETIIASTDANKESEKKNARHLTKCLGPLSLGYPTHSRISTKRRNMSKLKDDVRARGFHDADV